MEPLDSGLHAGGLTEFFTQPVSMGTDLQAGTRLGDVTLVRLVGEGGMGRVYEGLQGMPCRTVAVKVMRPGVLSPAATRRFEHEAQILGRLTHPGIAHIYSVGMQPLASGAVPYFVMEYIEDAQPITAFSQGRDLGTRDRVALFRAVCQAVAHGHQKGVIHRDLKPGNILIDAAGHPKVIDFGVARSTDGDIALTTMHTDAAQLVGTLQYMSPEQFDGDAGELDIRADVYALGVVLYELLAGKPPYDIARRPIYDAARVVREVEPRSLATVNPRLRGDLATIVAKCLEKDRSRRYSSAAELEADLGRYLRGEPIAAHAPGFVDGLMRLARRHRLAAGAVVAVAGALFAASVGISIFAVQAERERRSAVLERQRADDASRVATERLYGANLRSLQAALDNRNIRLARRLYADNLAITGTPPPLEMRLLGAGLDDALAVLDLKRGPVSRVRYRPDGGVLAAAASTFPEFPVDEVSVAGRQAFLANSHSMINVRDERLVFFATDRSGGTATLPSSDAAWVRVWRAESGELAAFERPARGVGVPLAITPDGRRIAVHASSGLVQVVDADTRVVRASIAGHQGRLARTAFTADGSRLVLQDPQGGFGIWNAEDGSLVVRIGSDDLHVEAFVVSPDGSRVAVIDASANESGNRTAQAVEIYATTDGRRLTAITMLGAAPLTPANTLFSPDGTRLVTVADDDDLRVWDASTGRECARLEGHSAAVTAMQYDPEGRQIAAGAANGAIRLWNADTFVPERELLAHDSAVLALAFQPDEGMLASGSHDGTVRIWSRTGVDRLADLERDAGMTAVAFSPDGSWLAVAPRGSGTVELWDPRRVERRAVFNTDAATVTVIEFAADGRRVAAALAVDGPGADVRVWSVPDGRLVTAIGPHERGVAGVFFNGRGTRLLTTARAGVVRCWDVESGRRLLELARTDVPEKRDDARAIFGLGGSRIVSTMREMFDAETGSILGELPPRGSVTAMAVSPDGRLLASGVASGTVYLTDMVTGDLFARIPGHSSAVRAAVFSTDGRQLVTGSADGTARLWDVRTATERQVLSGHEAPVEQVIITPDARRVVTASRDGTVRIWDAESGFEVCQLPGQPEWPQAVALSPDGALLAAAAVHGPIRIHGLSNADVTRNRALRASEQDSSVPPASRETPPDRPDPVD